MKKYIIIANWSKGYQIKYKVECETLADACIMARALCMTDGISSTSLTEIETGFMQMYKHE